IVVVSPLLFCFFFQAEDGIRCFHVTGVQTCALPILWPLVQFAKKLFAKIATKTGKGFTYVLNILDSMVNTHGLRLQRLELLQQQIGRASCRDRVKRWLVGLSVDKKISYVRQLFIVNC